MPKQLLALVALAIVFALPLRLSAADRATSLRVCVSTPDLKSLVEEIGGNKVTVITFAKGEQDPHNLEILPTFVKELGQSDLLVTVGNGLEDAWLPRLIKEAKPAKISNSQNGRLEIADGLRPLELPGNGAVAQSLHEGGNPHYLLDPLEGWRAARLIKDRLCAIRPEMKEEFTRNHSTWQTKLGVLLVGEECAKNDDVEKLLMLLEGKTADQVKSLLKEHSIGGWIAETLPYRGKTFVGDHDLWPYFARRFGLNILAYLEPSPGVPPTTKHLQSVIGKMKESQVNFILTAPYFEPRHAAFVAKNTKAAVVPMAHQTGARAGCETYLKMVSYNHQKLMEALRNK